MKTCPRCSATYPDDYAVCPKDGTLLAGAGSWEPDSIIRGKYKIVAKIGEGGMAAVYRANHLLLDEVRALKVIKADLARDEQFVRRFKNEAINTRKLQHVNAVRVDDLDIAEDSRPFIAMELVEGESLKARILRLGPLPVSATVDIALQVCAALEAAHALGLVHRDIKPDNIVLIERRDSIPLVKILDFGIARLKEATAGASQSGMTLTGTGVVIGTPDYMSPEQAMGKRGDDLDGRSDLYSLGIVMYRMLTGELPFKADTTVGMIMHHIQTIPKPPQTLKPELGIPDSISAIVMRVLEKDREKRFASAAAMAETLRHAQGLTVAVRAPALIASQAQAAGPDPRLIKTKPASAPFPNAPARAPSPSVSQVRPLAPAPAKKAESSRRGVLWATLALVLVVAWVFSLRRPKPPETQPAPAPEAPAAVAPSTSEPAQTPDPSSSSPALSTRQPTVTPGSKMSPSTVRPGARPRSPAVTSPSPTAKPTAERAAPPSSPASSSTTASGPTTKSKLAPWPSGVTQFSSQPSSEPPSSNSKRARETPSSEEGQTRGALSPEQQQVVRQLNDAATELLRQGEFVRAAQTYRQVLQIAPNNSRAQLGLQRALDVLGQKGQGSQEETEPRRSGGRRRP